MKKCVKIIIAYGKAGNIIANQLKNEFELIYVENFEDAILMAHNHSQSGDTILLSPACSSFDQFLNYEERGDKFTQIFTKLELGI